MKTVKVRRAIEADVSKIQELAYHFFEGETHRDAILNVSWPYLPEGKKHFQTMIAGKDCLCLVAEMNGCLIGYLTGKILKPNTKRLEKQTELENIFVEEPHRDKHAGTLLIQAFLRWSNEQDVKIVLVEAYPANKKTINFYKKLGFSPYWLTLKMRLSDSF